jgi:hypothetical protein
VSDVLFQRLSVFLIQGEHEKRHHDNDHEQRGKGGRERTPYQKEKRQSNQNAASEAENLTLCQIENEFGFDL